MKKNVNLKIVSSQYEEKLQPSGEAFVRELELDDSMEILTEGTLYTKNDALYITYNESKEMGLEDTRTVIKMTEDPLCVRIRRYGKGDDDNMDMYLQPGRLNITRYKIPQVGGMDIEVYTNNIEKELDEELCGKLMVDYKISFDRLFSRRNKIEIDISQA